MNTERGEPTWVNWSKTEWAIVEAKQDAAQVGEMISVHKETLDDILPCHPEEWERFYDRIKELEEIAHEFLMLIEKIRRKGVTK